MLHTESVNRSTLELIRKLQLRPYLKDFYLVGGTALSLHFGHRKSLDIDLFSSKEFNVSSVLEQMQQEFSFQIFTTDSNTLRGNIEGVNLDLLSHRYSFVKKPVLENNIKVLSIPDILAMKLNAIAVSGERSKDFIDVYFGLEQFSIAEMLSFYKRKYDQQSAAHVLKSLIYYDDVDIADWPVLLKKKNLSWKEVKSRIENEVKSYIRER